MKTLIIDGEVSRIEVRDGAITIRFVDEPKTIQTIPTAQLELATIRIPVAETVSDFCRKAQRIGVAARLKATTPEQRTEQASIAAKARWAKTAENRAKAKAKS